VNVDRDKAAFRKTRLQGKITWRSFWDKDGVIASDWNIEYIPASYVIDHKGIVRSKPATVEEQDVVLKSLMDEIDR
jgi:hypothetical protein